MCPSLFTRARKAPVVIISLEDYQAMEGTTYLLRSPANALHLLESIAELEKQKSVEQKVIE
ncbi:MAG: type II toxin-antitoxin system Phd/YefM family antitoxin [Nitrosomonas sp.]